MLGKIMVLVIETIFEKGELWFTYHIQTTAPNLIFLFYCVYFCQARFSQRNIIERIKRKKSLSIYNIHTCFSMVDVFFQQREKSYSTHR